MCVSLERYLPENVRVHDACPLFDVTDVQV